jgi:hypothetical protein
MSYAARAASGGTVPLDIKLYSSGAWDIAENQICEGGNCISQPRDPTERSDVTLRGRDAELLLIAGGTRRVNVAMLLIDMGDTTVVAKAYATASTTTGGPDPNPLIDPDELLRVMEQLRPYPE